MLKTVYTWEIFYLSQALAAAFFTYLYLFYDLHNKPELKHTSSHYLQRWFSHIHLAVHTHNRVGVPILEKGFQLHLRTFKRKAPETSLLLSM